jgi:hypothetical protein
MTSTSFPYPHPTLTPVTGKPDAASLKLLRKEVYANTKSVPSTAGGGLNGHLGLAMPTAAYVIRAGIIFEQPDHPGPLPDHPGNATSAQITAANRTYDTELADFNTCVKVREEVKQQILGAVDTIYLQNLEDDVFGYADVNIQTIFAHLSTQYGTLEASDIEANRNKLAEQWNPDEPFENFWLRVKRIRAVATAGADPIQDGATIELSLTAFRKAGVYDHAITTWEDKPLTDQTWENFHTHFNHHEKTRIKRLTTKAAGYHGANHGKAVTPDTNNKPTEIAASIKPLPTGHKDKQNFECDDIQLFYCWTHGLSKNPKHTSASCNAPAEDHRTDATLENRLGGINKINFGRSGKQRRLPV